ncbi:hephaestin-like protein [Diadema antillarum]|uniref:hephaestin-like protein n=1 Tax=Diadema antillarum TaxID=105358 RepID=UPI003A895EEB
MMDRALRMLLLVAVIGCLIGCACAANRVYYIAAVEETWDYVPSGIDNITGQSFPPNSAGANRVFSNPNRIGSRYKKALFREYTDDTFTTQSPRPAWLGILGPTLRAEVGDTITVHFRNMASRPYSINPSGLTYTKSSEGALYNDGTSGSQKEDDNVGPGQTYVYRWSVNAERSGPNRDGGEDCIAWMYNSHRFDTQDINSGLVGVTIVCRRGRLSTTDNDHVLLYAFFDENKSWYINENIQTYVPQVSDQERETMGFLGSNMMYTVNGYSYGNLPDLELCQGETTRWFVFTVGGETSIHTVFFNGNPLEQDGRRADNIPLIPGPVNVVSMTAENPGTWLLSSLSTSDATNGGSAVYTVNPNCTRSTGSSGGGSSLTGRVIRHYIGIREVNWNYAPYVSKSPTGTGPIFRKAQYIAYTDETFTTEKQRPQEEQYLGFAGPVIRAEVGDTIEVMLMNFASRSYNIHPNNVKYDKLNEGWPYPAEQGIDDVVGPNQSRNYTWTVPASYGPTDMDEQCITGIYYSTVGGEQDLHSGLVGPLLVCKQGSLRADGSRASEVREVITMIVSLNEELSWYWPTNQNVQYNDDFPVAELRTINGFVSDNLRGLDLCEGDRVSWHAPCIGNDETYMGLHIPYQTFLYKGRRANTLPLLPGETEQVALTAGMPGTWILNGNVYNYDLEVNYTVSECSQGQNGPNRERQNPDRHGDGDGGEHVIYLAAEEVIWDFAPTEFDYIQNQSMTDPTSDGNYFIRKGPTEIGRLYKKVRFVEYTDMTFEEPKTRSYWDQHLGILGPFIRTEIGDTVKIFFKNKATRPYSVNAHNLPGQLMEYRGQTYDTPLSIQPGENAVYKWNFGPEAGPTDDQPNCVVWPYYSSTIAKKDTNSGLIGPLVICRRGTLDRGGRRQDVDREYALLLTIFDENDNWYLDDNINTYAGDPSSVDKLALSFEHSNDAFAINGYIFGFPLNISMAVGEQVAWYMITVGGGADVHAINFHGHTVTFQSQVTKTLDTVTSLPGDFLTAEMEARQAGIWLLHDNANKHNKFGVKTRFTVYPSKSDIPCGDTCDTSSALKLAVNAWSLLATLIVAWLGVFF